MTIYAVIDTNVIISSLLTSNQKSPTLFIIKAIEKNKLTPVYSDYLLSEYVDVLSRSKFCIPENLQKGIVESFKHYGIRFEPVHKEIEMPDQDDVPIFLITMQTRDLDTYLVTGNTRHYPPVDYVVSPKKMMAIIEEQSQ